MNGLHAGVDILSLWFIKCVFMYSAHFIFRIVFIYEVRVGKCMRAFPVVRPLFRKQNVLSISTTADPEYGEEVLRAKVFLFKGMTVSTLVQTVRDICSNYHVNTVRSDPRTF